MTEQTQPTDAEIEAAWTDATGSSILPYPGEMLAFARAVLAKWGTPAGAGELRDAVLAYRSASEELLRAQRETLAQLGTTSLPIEQAWVKPFDAALLAQEKMYAVLDATPQAGAVPLTDEWIRSRCKEPWIFETAKQWIRIAESAHGIKGADHGQPHSPRLHRTWRPQAGRLAGEGIRYHRLLL